eukprot:GGOE01021606.1.p1 GENE.GGOE01021606.1~~GGOE01021606.1.p1  ORF type:complete len:406 (-),score=21.71 GGOE01021606.1:307-1524(-)
MGPWKGFALPRRRRDMIPHSTSQNGLRDLPPPSICCLAKLPQEIFLFYILSFLLQPELDCLLLVALWLHRLVDNHRLLGGVPSLLGVVQRGCLIPKNGNIVRLFAGSSLPALGGSQVKLDLLRHINLQCQEPRARAVCRSLIPACWFPFHCVVYRGQRLKGSGVPHGYGTFWRYCLGKWHAQCNGHWARGRLAGECHILSPCGSVMVLQSEENEGGSEVEYQMAHGTQRLSGGKCITGDFMIPLSKKGIAKWWEAVLHGKGMVECPGEGSLLSGDFRHGHADGSGIRYYSDGGCYLGQFQEGERHGWGMHTWPSGLQYTGAFSHDAMDGKGEMWWPSGNVYRGTFTRGSVTGVGFVRWSDGQTYEGPIQDAFPHGDGKYTDSCSVVCEGTFQMGKLMCKDQIEDR